MEMDFDPGERLRAALKGRSKEYGFSIDKRGTHLIDDGLFVRRYECDGWLMQVSIVDLPSVIPPGSNLEKFARRALTERREGKTVFRLFPVAFLDRYVSMVEGATRPAHTISLYLDKDFNLTNMKIRRTAFINRHQYFDGAFEQFPGTTEKDHTLWRELSQGLYAKRLRDMAHSFDLRLYTDAKPVEKGRVILPDDMRDGIFLIHEAMRLVNRSLSDYFLKEKVPVPLRDQRSAVRVSSVTPDFEFDRLCNRMLVHGVREMVTRFLPYVHFNSPMRDYRDYLANRIMGDYARNKAVNPQLTQEAMDLNQRSSIKAADHCMPLTAEWWNAKWLSIGMEQTIHPLARTSVQGYQPVAELRRQFLCAARDLPAVAERTIDIQGLTLTFAGINAPQPHGRDVQSWAIGYDPDETLARAAERLLMRLPS